jgi:ABC-type methionine transport system permease subunit
MAAEEIAVNVVDKVQAVLGTIAQKLGQGVDYFWPVFVRQQVVASVFGIVLIVLGAILGAITLKVGYKMFMEGKTINNEWDVKRSIGFVVLLFCFIFLAASIIGTAAGGYQIATGLINPEYAAVRDVVQMVQGVK